MSQVWHYSRDGERHGPVTAGELKRLAASGELSPDDSVWKDGMEKWMPARSVKGLFSGRQREHTCGEGGEDNQPPNGRSKSPLLMLGILGGAAVGILLLAVVVTFLLTQFGRGRSSPDGQSLDVSGNQTADGGKGKSSGRDEPRVIDKPLLSMRWPGVGGPEVLAFSPDGKRLLAVTQNHPFNELYDLSSGKPLPKGGMLVMGSRVRKRVKDALGADVSAGTFPADQAARFLMDDDEKAEAYQYKVSKSLLEGNREAGRGGRPLLSPEGRFLLVDRQTLSRVIGGRGELGVYDTESGEVRLADATVQDLTTVGPHRYAFSPGGDLLVLSSKAGVKVWDLAEARKGGLRARLATTLRPETPLMLCEFSGDGKRLALGWLDTKARKEVVQVLDTSSWKPVGSIEVLPGNNPRRLFSPDGRTLAVIWQESRTGKDGKKYTGWTVALHDTVTGKQTHRIESDNADQVLFTSDGKTLVLGCRILGTGDPSHVDLWDVGTGRLKTRIVGRQVRCFALSSDGWKVATGSRDGTVQVWDVGEVGGRARDPKPVGVRNSNDPKPPTEPPPVRGDEFASLTTKIGDIRNWTWRSEDGNGWRGIPDGIIGSTTHHVGFKELLPANCDLSFDLKKKGRTVRIMFKEHPKRVIQFVCMVVADKLFVVEGLPGLSDLTSQPATVGDKAVRIRVVLSGEVFEFWADGKRMATAKRKYRGQVHLVVSSGDPGNPAEAEFTNFRIKAP